MSGVFGMHASRLHNPEQIVLKTPAMEDGSKHR